MVSRGAAPPAFRHLHCSPGVCARQRQRGFTLIELLVVVTIVGLLAGIAVVRVLGANKKAAENVLMADLHNIRAAIDNYYADKQHFPSSLNELVESKYLSRVPPDPITKSADTWIEVTEEPDPESFAESIPSDASGPGVSDVKSGAEGETSAGIPYGEL